MDSIFVYRNPETAVPRGGPLQGLKIAIQPNISVAGWPTDAGSNALANFTALEDATIVERLRQAGAVFVRLNPHERIRLRFARQPGRRRATKRQAAMPNWFWT